MLGVIAHCPYPIYCYWGGGGGGGSSESRVCYCFDVSVCASLEIGIRFRSLGDDSKAPGKLSQRCVRINRGGNEIIMRLWWCVVVCSSYKLTLPQQYWLNFESSVHSNWATLFACGQTLFGR